jgi:hypothetical protein
MDVFLYNSGDYTEVEIIPERCWSPRELSYYDGITAQSAGSTAMNPVGQRMFFEITLVKKTGGHVRCKLNYKITGNKAIQPAFKARYGTLAIPPGQLQTERVIGGANLLIDKEQTSAWVHNFASGSMGGFESGVVKRNAGADSVVAPSKVSLNYQNTITMAPNEPRTLLSVSGNGDARVKYRSTGRYLQVRGRAGTVKPDTWVSVRPNDSLTVEAVGVPYGVYRETVTVDAELP